MLTFVDYKLGDIKETPNEFMGGLDVIWQVIFTKLHQSRTHGFSNQELMDLISLEQSFGKKT
jgi:hypothetical protein